MAAPRIAPARPARLHRLFAVLSVVAVLGHLYGLYRPTGPPSLSWLPHADKAEHVIGFAAPVALILLTRRFGDSATASSTARSSRRFGLVVVVVFAVHAVVSELVQHYFYVHRTGDPYDALADWIGVALGWVTGQALGRGRAQSSGSGALTSGQVP